MLMSVVLPCCPDGVGRPAIGGAVQILRDRAGLRDTRHPQGTTESAASHRQSQAIGVVVQMCSPAGEPAGRVRDEVDAAGVLACDGDDPQ